jgi:putative restriction endonuclease
MTVNISRFFTETLGANLKNPRWSWGAADPRTNRVFLRVWADQIKKTSDGEHVPVAWDKPRRKSNGFAERHAHIEQITAGSEGFGVVCTAADPDTKKARKIAAFDQDTLLRFGAFTNERGRTFAKIDARVAVSDLARQQTSQSTLTEDLRTIVRQKIKSTTKESLVNARVGQGLFRSQVLQLWGNSCAVTGAVTLDGIRASHIKPWRDSTHDERLDPRNGLPLIANIDALFDAGLISFASTGTMIVSSQLRAPDRSIFALDDRRLRKVPPQDTLAYLEYHRSHVFKK